MLLLDPCGAGGVVRRVSVRVAHSSSSSEWEEEKQGSPQLQSCKRTYFWKMVWTQSCKTSRNLGQAGIPEMQGSSAAVRLLTSLSKLELFVCSSLAGRGSRAAAQGDRPGTAQHHTSSATAMPAGTVEVGPEDLCCLSAPGRVPRVEAQDCHVERPPWKERPGDIAQPDGAGSPTGVAQQGIIATQSGLLLLVRRWACRGRLAVHGRMDRPCHIQRNDRPIAPAGQGHPVPASWEGRLEAGAAGWLSSQKRSCLWSSPQA